MARHRYRAQAMVEFSLVIVLLLVLILGIIEVARVLFIYSSIITSSREAVRYGSVTGHNDAGTLFYQDCAGIRSAAKKTSFLQNIQDSNITIEYDTGPGTAVYDTCTSDLDASVSLATDSRILVTVTAAYKPIIPLVPITGRTIVFSSARTIIGTVKFEP